MYFLERDEWLELLQAITVIQDDICDQLENAEGFEIILNTNGYYATVEFMGVQIWNSEYDEREIIHASNSYERFEPFLRKRITSILENLQKLKLS